MLYKADILAICPKARPDIVEAMVLEGYRGAWERFGLDTVEAKAKFMGQIAVESAGLTVLEENLNYSAARLCKVWPKRFPNIAAAQPYARNPEKLANKVYGGRLGNTQEGDGWRYRGRGLKQLTGRANYREAGEALGVDLEENPDLVSSPDMGFLTALAFWERHIGSRERIKGSDLSVKAITKIVNGGYNGLESREVATKRALEILIPNKEKQRSLKQGCRGLDVTLLQAQMVELGHQLKLDGVFGGGMTRAVMAFQVAHGLASDGIYGAATRGALAVELLAARVNAAPLDPPSDISSQQEARSGESATGNGKKAGV